MPQMYGDTKIHSKKCKGRAFHLYNVLKETTEQNMQMPRKYIKIFRTGKPTETQIGWWLLGLREGVNVE